MRHACHGRAYFEGGGGGAFCDNGLVKCAMSCPWTPFHYIMEPTLVLCCTAIKHVYQALRLHCTTEYVPSDFLHQTQSLLATACLAVVQRLPT